MRVAEAEERVVVSFSQISHATVSHATQSDLTLRLFARCRLAI